MTHVTLARSQLFRRPGERSVPVCPVRYSGHFRRGNPFRNSCPPSCALSPRRSRKKPPVVGRGAGSVGWVGPPRPDRAAIVAYRVKTPGAWPSMLPRTRRKAPARIRSYRLVVVVTVVRRCRCAVAAGCGRRSVSVLPRCQAGPLPLAAAGAAMCSTCSTSRAGATLESTDRPSPRPRPRARSARAAAAARPVQGTRGWNALRSAVPPC
jgi:hypothetical protein